jgi:hypothetical protein
VGRSEESFDFVRRMDRAKRTGLANWGAAVCRYSKINESLRRRSLPHSVEATRVLVDRR